MCRYHESFLPEGYRVRVAHLHPGNSSSNQRKKLGKTNARYVTIARLFTQDGEVPIGKGIAACSSKDNPSRHLGREIAVGRAMANAGVTSCHR